MQLSRRMFLALSATFTIAACGEDDTAVDSDTSPGTTPDPAPTEAPADTTTTTTTATSTTSTTVPEVELADDPFLFGVGSGDPDASSVVLWTRLAGELPTDGIDVTWTFEPEDGSETIVGTTTTSPAVGGSVHALAELPGPGSFTFSAGGWESPVGRTAPIDPATAEFRFATASCQNYQSGRWAAHRDIADWQPDLVVFLGDFMYEGSATELGEGVIRLHDPGEPMDLDAYRRRYATYLSDPQLQASRGAAPWLVIWDDHEVENDYAGLSSEDRVPEAEFAARRAQAYQAWWENTPTRLPPPVELVDDPTARYEIYRGLDVGSLLRISALDGRQFRDDQVSDAILETGPPAAGWDDPDRSMLGAEQEAWVVDRFATTTSTWNCLAQQTVLADARLGEVGAILNYDQWDGYAAARQRLLDAAPGNFVVVTGDIHLAGVAELGPADDRLGVEFITTAISSTANVDPELAPVLLALPNIFDGELVFRGYTRHTVTPAAWSAEFRQVVDVSDADSEVRTWKTFTVDADSTTITPA
jgi:alkaline phosphatase D